MIGKIANLGKSEAISPNDRMFKAKAPQHYFYVGCSGLLSIFNIMNIRAAYPGGDTEVRAILDFGCGHGRVARWLRVGFPNAAIYVSDYDRTGIDWCVENFGCYEAPPQLPPSHYDIVWLGSVFTHLPASIAEQLLKDLLASLRPNGVLVFTTQGRYSVERMKMYDWEEDARPFMHYNLSRQQFELLIKEYMTTGYGFVNYPRQNNYGVTIANPTWYSERACNSCEYLQILFQEKGFDNHQDVSAFIRTNLLNTGKGPLWNKMAQK